MVDQNPQVEAPEQYRKEVVPDRVATLPALEFGPAQRLMRDCSKPENRPRAKRRHDGAAAGEQRQHTVMPVYRDKGPDEDKCQAEAQDRQLHAKQYADQIPIDRLRQLFLRAGLRSPRRVRRV